MKTYSFSNVAVVFGILQLSGFDEGDDVVTIEAEADEFTDSAGANGDVIRYQTNDHRCTITIKLQSTSTSNRDLVLIANADRQLRKGALSMLIQDKELGETWTIDEAWIKKIPKMSKGQKSGSYDWVFRGSNFTLIRV